MTAYSRRALFWAPRVLGILFAVFISLFALDVFEEGYGFWNTLLALTMHLIPTAIVAAVLVVAWRWEWVGAVLFAATGVFYMATALQHPDWALIISGPLFLIAVLFLINWLKRTELHIRPQKH
jgi:hypothetical protein